MTETYFVIVASIVIVVVVFIIFLYNFNEYKILNETKQEISKLNEEYFKKLKEKETPIFDYKIDSIERLEEIVNELKEISSELMDETSLTKSNIDDIKKKINDIEVEIIKKNDEINEMKKNNLEK